MTGINRQPRGLSDLVQIRAGGSNPDDLSSVVSPTIDIAPYYEADRLSAALETFDLSIGQAEFIEVPADEVWGIQSISAEIDNIVNNGHDGYLNFGIERVPPLGLNAIWLFGQVATGLGTAANMQLVVGGFLPRPLICNPGWRIVVQNGFATTGTATLVGTLNVLYVRMET